MDTIGAAEAGGEIVGVWAMLRRASEFLGLTSPPPPRRRHDGQAEIERHQTMIARQAAGRAIDRADKAVDAWNERVVQGWRADGAG